jgi:hypothetical protein
MALEDKTLPEGLTANPTVAAAIRAHLQDGLLSCAAACDAAEGLRVQPIEVGRTADALQVHLTRCQLGLFGFPGHSKGWEAAGVAALPVPDGLEDALRAARDEHEELACSALWREADRCGAPRIQAGFVADRLGIPIRHCQLGAF